MTPEEMPRSNERSNKDCSETTACACEICPSRGSCEVLSQGDHDTYKANFDRLIRPITTNKEK